MADTEGDDVQVGTTSPLLATDEIIFWRGGAAYNGLIGDLAFKDASGNFVLGAVGTAKARLQVNAAVSSPGGTLPSGGILLTDTGATGMALELGLHGSGGSAWVQARAWNVATVGDLLLNPMGGNVGIGTTSPLVRLHVVTASNEVARLHGQSANPFISFFSGAGAGTRKGYFQIVGSSYCAVVSELPDLVLTANGSSITLSSAGLTIDSMLRMGTSAKVRLYNGNSTNAADIYNPYASVGAGIAFTYGGGEVMRITEVGAVSIGQTTSGTAALGHKFNMTFAGGISLYGIGLRAQANLCNMMTFANAADAVAGSIYLNTTTVAFNTSCDRRLKKHIADAEDSGAIIDALQVRRFQWRGYTEGEDAVSHGLIAQEVVEHFPQAVTPGDDETLANGGAPAGSKTWQVDHSKLVPLLLKEIQSLRARVAALEGE